MHMARTTLDLDGGLLTEALAQTGEPTKATVIERGLRELIASVKRQRLLGFLRENAGKTLGGRLPRRRRS
jgi:Arc/MetJ family transcription regulator